MSKEIKNICIGISVILFAIVGIWYTTKLFSIWSREMAGKAELAEATFTKQIMIEEARSKNESAIMQGEAKVKLAEAEARALKISAQAEAEREVIRAEGVAQANEIIGSSLKGNDEYLRYLWVQGLNDGSSEVIYIPTEAGLPIMEAGKR